MVIRCLFIVEQQQLMNIGMLLVINQSETTSARLMLYRRTLAKMHPAGGCPRPPLGLHKALAIGPAIGWIPGSAPGYWS